MTNLIASLVITLSTNWTTIGMFTPSCGQSGCLVIHQSEDVQRGDIETNYVAEVEFNCVKHRFVIEKKMGGSIGERRVARSNSMLTNILCPTNMVIWSGSTLTNYHFDWGADFTNDIKEQIRKLLNKRISEPISNSFTPPNIKLDSVPNVRSHLTLEEELDVENRERMSNYWRFVLPALLISH